MALADSLLLSTSGMHTDAGKRELGEFESGGMARLLGPVGSAIFGGCGAIVVTLLWAGIFPALRKADRLE